MIVLQPTISITVSTFNRRGQLKEVLQALACQSVSRKLFEVIVCDSQSSDGTAQEVASFSNSNPDLCIRHLHTSNILAAKRNLGVEAAAGQFVVFLDDDCVPERVFVEKYIVLAEKTIPGERVVYCGEVRFPSDWVSRSNYYRFRDSRHFGKRNFSVTDYPTLSFKTIVVMNMFFEKKLFLETVGKVNEAFVGYGAEDQDLGWRLEAAGYKLISCNAKIEHRENSGTILGYGNKIFRTSRDGMTTLFDVQPCAANGISSLRSLDPLFLNRTTLDYFMYWVAWFLVKLRIHVLLGQFLSRTDSIRTCYSPNVYRFVLGLFYVEGTLSRASRLTIEKAKHSWS